jgi:hypothetical protein
VADPQADPGDLVARASRHAQAGELEAAAGLYARVLEHDPAAAQVAAALGGVLQRLERCDEAVAAYRQAIAAGIEDPAVYSNLGVIANAEGDRDAAIAHFERAAALAPAMAAPLVNLALAMIDTGRDAESLPLLEAASARGGFDDEIRWNRAAARLGLGDFAGGWQDYEARWRMPALRGARRDMVVPQWRGESLEGKNLHLWHEQGFGDTVQFCRYAALAAARGARVILEVQPALRRLCARLAGVAEVVDAAPDPVRADFHSPLLSLPLAFGTRTDTIPATLPYLHAPPAELARWGALLGPKRRPRVGLVWSTATRGHRGAMLQSIVNRSVPITLLAPLCGLDADFHSLQLGPGAEEAGRAPRGLHLIDHTGHIRDFADTAACMAGLDAVVSVDTAAAHVAAATGVPAFVLLRHAPCWRWRIDAATSPWYPGIRLFRQKSPNDWRAPVADLVAELDAFLRGLPSGSSPEGWRSRISRWRKGRSAG